MVLTEPWPTVCSPTTDYEFTTFWIWYFSLSYRHEIKAAHLPFKDFSYFEVGKRDAPSKFISYPFQIPNSKTYFVHSHQDSTFVSSFIQNGEVMENVSVDFYKSVTRKCTFVEDIRSRFSTHRIWKELDPQLRFSKSSTKLFYLHQRSFQLIDVSFYYPIRFLHEYIFSNI